MPKKAVERARVRLSSRRIASLRTRKTAKPPTRVASANVATTAKPAAAPPAASSWRYARMLGTRRAQVLAAAAVVLVVAATAVMISRRHAVSSHLVAADVPPQASATVEAQAPPRPAVKAARSTRAVSRVSSPASHAVEPDATPAATPPPETTRAASMPAATSQEAKAVTVTGCLERDDARFHLKDTDGDAVQQSRSWKTGFLTRRKRSIDVVDPQNQFRLADHVGERVNATGTLVGGDMQLRSLRRIATSCDKQA